MDTPLYKTTLKPFNLGGIFVPTLTPFITINSLVQLDIPSHVRHIKILSDSSSGISGLFLASNAGQGRDMDMKTVKRSIKVGVEAARSIRADIPVVVGALRKDIEAVIEVAQYAEEVGANAVVIAPGYTHGDFDEIVNRVALSVALPLVIYNNPEFQSERNLPFTCIDAFALNSHVVGIKDTSGDSDYFDYVLNSFKSKGKRVMQGDTKAGLSEHIRKADGMVPVEANLFPKILSQILNPTILFDSSQLRVILDTLEKNEMFFGGSIQYLKHQLVEKGVFTSDVPYSFK